MGSTGSIKGEDLTKALQKLHEAFTDLAARYQVIHNEVTKHKEQYLAIHRLISNDSFIRHRANLG